MARYLITAAAFIAGVYYPADVTSPQEITISDTEEPSRKWTPLDDGAKAAQAALFAKDAANLNSVVTAIEDAKVTKGKKNAPVIPAAPVVSAEDLAIIEQIKLVESATDLYVFQVEGRSDYVEAAINAKGMELLKAAQAV